MTDYEYKVVPAQKRGVKAKGVKGAEARFAHAIELQMNEMSGEGWEFLRSETLPSEERSGLTSSHSVWRTLLVFRRPLAAPEEVPESRRLAAPSDHADDHAAPSRPAAPQPELARTAAAEATTPGAGVASGVTAREVRQTAPAPKAPAPAARTEPALSRAPAPAAPSAAEDTSATASGTPGKDAWVSPLIAGGSNGPETPSPLGTLSWSTRLTDTGGSAPDEGRPDASDMDALKFMRDGKSDR